MKVTLSKNLWKGKGKNLLCQKEGKEMMGLFNENIIPYKGTKSFFLGAKLEDVRKLLKENHIPFNQNIESNKGCTPEVPWTYIEIGKSITLCFAMDILFEILVY